MENKIALEKIGTSSVFFITGLVNMFLGLVESPGFFVAALFFYLAAYQKSEYRIKHYL